MHIYALTGATGVGKTTMHRALNNQSDICISTDEIREELRISNPSEIIMANTYMVGNTLFKNPTEKQVIEGFIRQRNIVMNEIASKLKDLKNDIGTICIEGIHIDVIRLWEFGQVVHHHIPMPSKNIHIQNITTRNRPDEFENIDKIRIIGHYLDVLYSN